MVTKIFRGVFSLLFSWLGTASWISYPLLISPEPDFGGTLYNIRILKSDFCMLRAESN